MDKKILCIIGIVALNMGVAILPAQANVQSPCSVACGGLPSGWRHVYITCTELLGKKISESAVQNKVNFWKGSSDCNNICASEWEALCSQDANEKKKQCDEWQKEYKW